MEVIKTYNRGIQFCDSPGATEREVKVLVLDPDVRKDVEKAKASVRGKYLMVAFILSSYRRRYGDLIVALKTTMQ